VYAYTAIPYTRVRTAWCRPDTKTRKCRHTVCCASGSSVGWALGGRPTQHRHPHGGRERRPTKPALQQCQWCSAPVWPNTRKTARFVPCARAQGIQAESLSHVAAHTSCMRRRVHGAAQPRLIFTRTRRRDHRKQPACPQISRSPSQEGNVAMTILMSTPPTGRRHAQMRKERACCALLSRDSIPGHATSSPTVVRLARGRRGGTQGRVSAARGRRAHAICQLPPPSAGGPQAHMCRQRTSMNWDFSMQPRHSAAASTPRSLSSFRICFIVHVS